MCGGAGTRLWPVSRESMPQQFVSLVGDQSTFQEVVGRVTDTEIFGRPIVITIDLGAITKASTWAREIK